MKVVYTYVRRTAKQGQHSKIQYVIIIIIMIICFKHWTYIGTRTSCPVKLVVFFARGRPGNKLTSSSNLVRQSTRNEKKILVRISEQIHTYQRYSYYNIFYIINKLRINTYTCTYTCFVAEACLLFLNQYNKFHKKFEPV